MEKRAFKMAFIATGHQEDALDIVQDAMMTLAERYYDKPFDEWPPLFHRIMQSKIRDWYRRQKVRNQWRQFFRLSKESEIETDIIENAKDQTNNQPDDKLEQSRAMQTLEKELHLLPLRQQQAFLLRVWEGLDVAQTAASMGCSQGSVKTHYSRAIHRLRETLGEHYELK